MDLIKNKNSLIAIVVSALCAAAALAAFALWKFDSASERELERTMRQYDQTRTQIARYNALKRTASSPERGNAESLFSQVNQIGAKLGIARRIEALRPSEDASKGRESLDLQVRSLYLREFVQFLKDVEGLANVNVERISVSRPANMLLDMEMKISRLQPES